MRNIEILGEATKLLSKKIREQNPEILWKNIAGTRDKLIHNYFGVNVDIVWNILKEDLPKLKIKIGNVL
ncbi:MAG: HepT-like ribonuclease domain-containing protein [Verrucomicrobiota bacterium]|nr:HepT-like ribonuclease domain-containing protein [Verrucomicrobiota bacterium]